MILIYKLTNRLFKLLYKGNSYIYRGIRFFEAMQIGFFLGIFKKNQLKSIDKWSYNKESQYTNDAYNKTQHNWEKFIVQKYFKDCKSIFVIGAGGGREVYNLSKLGYDVEGCEYNQNLCDYANKFLTREGISSKILVSKRDACPSLNKLYDSIIIGWGAYAQIKGTECRILFLKDISKYLNKNGVILLSFWPINYSRHNLSRIENFGNIISKIFNNSEVERGDTLEPEFIHCFSKEEIENELRIAGFIMDYFNTEEYGHAVGIKI